MIEEDWSRIQVTVLAVGPTCSAGNCESSRAAPEDYPVLSGPLMSGKGDAVFGSRFMNGPTAARGFCLGKLPPNYRKSLFGDFDGICGAACMGLTQRRVAGAVRQLPLQLNQPTQ